MQQSSIKIVAGVSGSTLSWFDSDLTRRFSNVSTVVHIGLLLFYADDTLLYLSALWRPQTYLYITHIYKLFFLCVTALQMQNERCKQKLSVSVGHAFNQWQGCLKDGVYLNQLLGRPLEEPQIARWVSTFHMNPVLTYTWQIKLWIQINNNRLPSRPSWSRPGCTRARWSTIWSTGSGQENWSNFWNMTARVWSSIKACWLSSTSSTLRRRRRRRPTIRRPWRLHGGGGCLWATWRQTCSSCSSCAMMTRKLRWRSAAASERRRNSTWATWCRWKLVTERRRETTGPKTQNWLVKRSAEVIRSAGDVTPSWMIHFKAAVTHFLATWGQQNNLCSF